MGIPPISKFEVFSAFSGRKQLRKRTIVFIRTRWCKTIPIVRAATRSVKVYTADGVDSTGVRAYIVVK